MASQEHPSVTEPVPKPKPSTEPAVGMESDSKSAYEPTTESKFTPEPSLEP